MFKSSLILCCLYLCAFTPLISAMSDEQKARIHSHFEMIGKECNKDSTMITADDIINLRGRKMPTGPNAPCFLACMLRQLGILDANGMLQGETVLELAKAVFEDPEELKIIAEYLHSCGHINSEAVSDGEKGCDRAMLAYKCMIDNASKFGIEI